MPADRKLRKPAPGLCRAMVVLAVLAAAVAAGCSGDGGPEAARQAAVGGTTANVVELFASASVLITADPDEPTVVVDSISILPGSIVADPGETVHLSAAAFGQGGETLTDVEMVWSIADPRAGTITRDGRFQAGTTPGAYADGISVTGIQNTPAGIRYSSSFASVTVVGEARAARMAAVVAIPGSVVVLKHQIYRMRAVGLDEDGLVIPGVKFVWELSDSRLGRINDIGYFTVEGGEGTYPDVISVMGIWEGVKITAKARVTVVTAPEIDEFLTVHALPQRFFLDPGDRMQLRAVALNGLGELAAGTVLRWTMANAAAGAIDGTGNFIAGAAPGIYTEAVRVEAVVPGESGFARAVDFASVVIRTKKEPGRLKNTSVVPSVVVIASNNTVTLRVRAVDESGDGVKNVTLHWEALEALVGEISPLGTFTAGSVAGKYPAALQVRVEQRLGEETITQTRTVDVVVTGTLSAADVSPSLAVVAAGRTVHFSVVGWDENDVELPGIVVLWSVPDESVGSIDPFGNFTAGRVPGLYEGLVRARIVQTLRDQR